MECPQVTLDTNLLLEYWKQQDRRMIVERLIELARAGRVNLAVTARIDRTYLLRLSLSSLIDCRRLKFLKQGQWPAWVFG